ncbi:conserved hypothetical protein [Burkholderiales bacterium 8X]|nr:conserved hypothetical protein [Burkholderiales bacterium 8X]
MTSWWRGGRAVRRTSRRWRFEAAAIGVLAIGGWLTGASSALAQGLPGPASMPDTPDRFPSAAMTFLEAEMPAMETAINERDRDYFQDAMGRVMDFSERWGYKTRDNPALARYPACTDAVADYLVVGLCRFKLSAETCQPQLTADFNDNLKACRALAGRR